MRKMEKEKIERIKVLRLQGHSTPSIAREMSVSTTSVIRILKEHGITTSKQAHYAQKHALWRQFFERCKTSSWKTLSSIHKMNPHIKSTQQLRTWFRKAFPNEKNYKTWLLKPSDSEDERK